MKPSGATEWATPKQLSEIEPAFSLAAIRWHIFNAERNGLQPHVRRIGRKIIINIAGFRLWIESQQ